MVVIGWGIRIGKKKSCYILDRVWIIVVVEKPREFYYSVHFQRRHKWVKQPTNHEISMEDFEAPENEIWPYFSAFEYASADRVSHYPLSDKLVTYLIASLHAWSWWADYS